MNVYGDDVNTLKLEAKTNYEYKEDDYVLVNAVKPEEGKVAEKGTIVGLAETFEGKFESKKSSKTTVSGTTYDNACTYTLGENIGNSVKELKTRTWFLDQYGNLIGNEEIKDAKSYGIVTYIEKIEATRDGSYFLADIQLVDETVLTDVKVAKLSNGKAAIYGGELEGFMSYNPADKSLVAQDLYKLDYDADEEEYTLYAGTYNDVEYTAKANSAYAPKQTKIDGTNPTMKLDDDTVFIIRSGKGTEAKPYTFEFVTGNDNIKKYTTAADRAWNSYYVDLDESGNSGYGYADYVYIMKDSTESEYKFAFITDKATDASSKNDDGSIKHTYTFPATGIDGETFDVVTEVNEKLLSKGKLYMIKFTDGKVKAAVDAVEVTNTVGVELTEGDYTAIYAGSVIVGDSAETAELALHKNDLTVGGKTYNLNDAVIVNAKGKVDADALTKIDLDAAFSSDSNEKKEVAQYVYVVYDTDDENDAVAVFLTTEAGKTPVYTVTVEDQYGTLKTAEVSYGNTFTYTLPEANVYTLNGNVVKSVSAANIIANTTIKVAKMEDCKITVTATPYAVKSYKNPTSLNGKGTVSYGQDYTVKFELNKDWNLTGLKINDVDLAISEDNITVSGGVYAISLENVVENVEVDITAVFDADAWNTFEVTKGWGNHYNVTNEYGLNDYFSTSSVKAYYGKRADVKAYLGIAPEGGDEEHENDRLYAVVVSGSKDDVVSFSINETELEYVETGDTKYTAPYETQAADKTIGESKKAIFYWSFYYGPMDKGYGCESGKTGPRTIHYNVRINGTEKVSDWALDVDYGTYTPDKTIKNFTN